MRSIIWIVFPFFLLPGILVAQDVPDVPKVEIFGGYSYFRGPSYLMNLDIDHYLMEKTRLNGWNVTGTVNLNRWLGADIDIGGYSGTFKTQSLRYGRPIFTTSVDYGTYLFGPRVSYRSDHRFTPFVHALLGIVGVVYTDGSTVCSGLALGGVLDIKVVRHVAIRTIQADYVRSRIRSAVQNNLRLSFGAVLRF